MVKFLKAELPCTTCGQPIHSFGRGFISAFVTCNDCFEKSLNPVANIIKSYNSGLLATATYEPRTR